MPAQRSIRDARYNAKSSRFFSLKLNVNLDAELIERLESADSINGYLRRLIRADIAAQAADRADNPEPTPGE